MLFTGREVRIGRYLPEVILKFFVIVNLQSAAIRLSGPYREIPDLIG